MCIRDSYYDLIGELWKIPNENDIEHRGVNHFFPEKENMPLDALIIAGFYFISTKCWYRTWVRNLMHDTHFLCFKVSLQVAQTHSCHPPHTRSPHSHALQELKDDLQYDTAWPVMQWLTEDHRCPLNRSCTYNWPWSIRLGGGGVLPYRYVSLWRVWFSSSLL